MSSKQATQLGPIEAGTCYPLREFQRRAGLGRYALTQMRQQGLRIIRTGGRAFVLGADFEQFLGRVATLQETSK